MRSIETKLLSHALDKQGTKLFLATAFNLALGLMPYLDNFAHVGGFITGIITGFSTMTLTRYTRDHDEKPKKTYQIILQAFGIITAPVLVVAMTATLYLGIDVSGYCEWCQFLTCVPIPNLWSCDPCEEDTKFDPANPGVISCPRGGGDVPIPVNQSIPTNLPELFALCRLACPV